MTLIFHTLTLFYNNLKFLRVEGDLEEATDSIGNAIESNVKADF